MTTMSLPTMKFPLNKTTDGHLLQLSIALWSWPVCDGCRSAQGCAIERCPAQRLKRLSRFFEFYRDIAAAYESDDGLAKHVVIGSHEDIFRIVKELRLDPDITRSGLVERLLGSRRADIPSLREDQERAINLAVRTMVMVNCTAQQSPLDVLEYGVFQTPWRSDIPFSQFITEIFPMTDHPGLNSNDENIQFAMDMKAALMAKKLKKRAGLKFRPTDDLRSHLKLDQKSGVVEIYHHTAFLKEHLRLTKDEPRNMSVADQLRLGALPRQLVLETLDSIQKVLFPLADPKSRSLLQSLTSTSSFDPDCLRFESASIRNQDEKDISYLYFGSRLVDLFEELENPQPRSWLEKWMERRSGARYVMMATVIGVAFAVILGMASLALTSYQTWLGYQQWQHPVVSPSK